MTTDAASTLADQFVEAVLSGSEPLANAIGSRLVSAAFEDGDGGHLQPVAQGVLLREDRLPTDPDTAPDECGLNLLATAVSPARLSALVDGATLTTAELVQWRDLAAGVLLSSWDLDWDSYEMWDVQRVQHTDGRVAYLAEVGGGYSWSSAHRDYVGAGATVEAAKAHLQSIGFTDVEDYRARRG